MKGIVIKSTGSWYSVKTEQGTIVECRLKGKFKIDGLKFTNPLAVGDYVILDNSEGTPVIAQWQERKNYITRESPRHQHARHIIAANLDQACLIATITQPRTSTGFIDRFLLTAEAYHIPVFLVINKSDLFGKKERERLLELQQIYRIAGYDLLVTSVYARDSLDKLIDRLRNKTTLLAGHSGVGKSSLINAISPSLHLRVGAISHKHEKGIHTTTYAEMHELDFGGHIIDTPGIKEFGITDMLPEEVGHYFREFQALIPQCKFTNCLHEEEPGCAVKQQLEVGRIHPERYLNYLNILADTKDKPRYLIKQS